MTRDFRGPATGVVAGIVGFIVLSVLEGVLLRAQTESPAQAETLPTLLGVLAVGAASAAVQMRLRRAGAIGFAAAFAICLLVGVILGGDTPPSTAYLFALPDLFTRGVWSSAIWLLLGVSILVAASRKPAAAPELVSHTNA